MKRMSIKKNFIYQMFYEVLVFILPLVTSPYIARVIGAEGVGVYTYSYSIAYYFVLVAMLGLKNYGNRSIAKVRDDQDELDRVFSELYYLHAGISVICIVAYIGYITLTRTSERLYAEIQLIYVVSTLFDVSWLFFGLEEFKKTVTRSCIVKLLMTIAIFVLVRTRDDLWKYCAIFAVGSLLSQLILWLSIGKYVRFVKASWVGMSRHLKPMLILFIPTIAISLYKYMDKIMIGTMSNRVQLGFYENSEKVVNIPLTIIGAFGTVMLPKMSNLISNKSREQAMKYIDVSMEYIMCLAFSLAFGLAAVARVFAPVFWGEEFSECGYLIMGLCITMPFISFANVIRTQYLLPNERDKEYLVSIIFGAVVNLIINGLLIPHMGAEGAVIGTIAAEITVCLIQVYSTRRDLEYIKYIRKGIPYLLYAVMMFCFVYAIGTRMSVGIVTLLIQIITGVVIYCIICAIHLFKTRNAFFLSALENVKKKQKGAKQYY